MYANRGDRIWTYGRPLPKRVLYQTELHPVKKYVSDILQNNTDGHQEGSHLSPTRVGFPILFSLGDVSTDVFQSVYSSTWTRTRDKVINSHLLYQLSYRGLF